MRRGWETKKIGEVCHLMTGGTPSRAKSEYFGGDIRWLVSGDIHQGEIFDCEGRITEAGMKNSNAKLLPVNSVMIALNGQGKTRGTVALLRTRATCNQSLVSIYPHDPEKLMPEFLYANLHGRYQEIRQMTGDTGNDRRGLNMILINGIEIPIAPMREQQRIVRLLDEAFEQVRAAKMNAEKNLQNTHALFESYLQSVFTQQGKGWVNKQLGEIADFKNGLNFNQRSSGQTVQVVGVGDFQNNYVVPMSGLHSATIDGDLEENYEIRENDILTVRSNGSKDLVGRCMLVPEVSGPISYSGFIIRIRFDASAVVPRFLLHFMKCSETRAQLTRDGGGANISNINQGKLSSLIVPLPSLTSQQEIADVSDRLLADTDSFAGIYERKVAALEALKNSLMHKAFSGDL